MWYSVTMVNELPLYILTRYRLPFDPCRGGEDEEAIGERLHGATGKPRSAEFRSWKEWARAQPEGAATWEIWAAIHACHRHPSVLPLQTAFPLLLRAAEACVQKPAWAPALLEAVASRSWRHDQDRFPEQTDVLVRSLVGAGLDPKGCDADGRPWITWARDASLRHALVRAGACLEAACGNGKTLAHGVVETADWRKGSGHSTQVLSTLVGIFKESPRLLSLPDAEGWTPQHRLTTGPLNSLVAMDRGYGLPAATFWAWEGTTPSGYSAARLWVEAVVHCMIGSDSTTKNAALFLNTEPLSGFFQRRESLLHRAPDGKDVWETLLLTADTTGRSDIARAMAAWLFPLDRWLAAGWSPEKAKSPTEEPLGDLIQRLWPEHAGEWHRALAERQCTQMERTVKEGGPSGGKKLRM